MVFTIFSPGDIIKSTEHNYDFNAGFKLQNEKAINDVSATNSGVLAGSSQVIIDKFLDSSGQNNTVDTGNTTAFYDSTYLNYICSMNVTGAELTQNAEATQASTQTDSYAAGYAMTVNINCKIISVTKHASCTATTARIRNISNVDLATATFSGNVATFSTPFTLLTGTYYEVVADKGGASYTLTHDNTPSWPYNNTYISFPTCQSGSGSAASNIASINVKAITYADSIVQSAVLTIPTGMTKVFVTPLMYEALSGSDAITASYSSTVNSNNAIYTYSPGSATDTVAKGMVFTALNNRYLKSVTMGASCTATRARLQDSGGSTLATATFSGLTATFTSGNQLTKGSSYRLVLDNSGSNYEYVAQLITMPVSYPEFTLTNGITDTTLTSYIYNISSVVLDSNTSESWTEISTNTWSTATLSPDLGAIGIRLNLDTHDGSTSPKISGWRVLLE